MLVDKIASEYNGLSIRGAVIFCKECGYNITRQGLSYIGKKYFFIKKIKNHNIVSKSGLLEYVDALNSPALGYVLISSLYYLARNRSHFYRVINKAIDNNSLAFIYNGKGLRRYAKESDIRKLFENN
jgi:hypothetical protein